MKRNVALCLFLAGISTLSAQNTDPATAPLNKNTGLPNGWLIQTQQSERKNLTLKESPEKNKRIIKLDPQKYRIEFFGDKLPYIKGDSVKVVLKARGKGTVSLGYFAYDDANKYLFFKKELTCPLAETEKTFEKIFEVVDGKDFATKNIRICIQALPGNRVEIIGVKAGPAE